MKIEGNETHYCSFLELPPGEVFTCEVRDDDDLYDLFLLKMDLADSEYNAVDITDGWQYVIDDLQTVAYYPDAKIVL